MKEKLENLYEQMMRAKRTTVFALLAPIDKEERQNIVWIDSHLDSWLDTVKELIVEAE